jgi:hypothetical protein
MSSNRPKKPLNPRAIVNDVARGLKNPDHLLSEAAKAARKNLTELPRDNFAEGVEAHRELSAVLRQEDIGRSLHGPDEVVRFPRYLVELFAALGTTEAATLLILASLAPEELDALVKISRREADRTVFHRIWGATWKAGLAIALPAYAFAKWGFEQLPFMKEVYNFLKGHF